MTKRIKVSTAALAGSFVGISGIKHRCIMEINGKLTGNPHTYQQHPHFIHSKMWIKKARKTRKIRACG